MSALLRILAITTFSLMTSCGQNSSPYVIDKVGEPSAKSECSNSELSTPEKETCIDEKENCYPGRNSQSVICRRELEDLTLAIKPAELVEISGVLFHSKGNLYLKGATHSNDKISVMILKDSCLKEEVKIICSLPENSVVTLIGAYYSTNVSSQFSLTVAGNLLALDAFEGGRQIPPPVE